jgi:hypothetical protein
MKAYGRVDVLIHIFLKSALTGDEWSASRPSRFNPGGKSTQYLLDRRLGGTQSRSGRHGEKPFYSTGTGTPTHSIVQPVASRYTDYAIPAPYKLLILFLTYKYTNQYPYHIFIFLVILSTQACIDWCF